MAAELRKEIEALMGTMGGQTTGRPLSDFKDRRVCRSYLVGFCPNELFLNTVGAWFLQ